MTVYGKINLVAMLSLPVVAMLAAVIMFGPRLDTMVTVFCLNAVPMLVGGLIAALLLRSAAKAGGSGRSIAIWPTAVPALVGIVWYLWGAFVPAELDPGREYIAAPQYLLVLALGTGFVAGIIGKVVRSARTSA